jgi:5-methylcytosine-specific restriction enzyme subunit McrC
VSEHETIDLPLDIVGPGGKLDVYPDVLNLFQVRFRNGIPRLQMDRYVGYIPLNDEYAVEVRPRVPIANLERLIGLASGQFTKVLQKHFRQFSHTDEKPFPLLDLLAAQLIESFERIWERGLLSTYDQKRQVSATPVGRIHVFESTWRSRKSGRPLSVSTAYHRTHDFGPNRVIAVTFDRLLRQLMACSDRIGSERRMHLRRIIERLNNISAASEKELSPRALSRFLKNLPPHHEQYAHTLLLSQLVLANAGIAIRGRGNLAVLPTILIDMEKVFEDYARNILFRHVEGTGGATEVLNGNLQRPTGASMLLFEDRPTGSGNSSVTPDIVISFHGRPALVVDAKYKPLKGLPDRSDINQVITYGVRYATSRVMLLYPNRPEGHAAVETLGTVGTIRVMVGRMDLTSSDMEAEESQFTAEVFASCSS